MATRRKLWVRKATPPPGMLTYREALIRATDQLSANPLLREGAFRDAVELFMQSTSVTRASLMAHPDRRVDREQQAAYQELVTRRLSFEPMQYILGEAGFFGHTLKVTRAVLIPRPETELLVEALIDRLSGRKGLRIVDVGTGSGAIAIALAAALEASVMAIDISAEALAVARENARACKVEDQIRFVEGDLLGALGGDAGFDAIVSNPPYIPQGDAAEMHPQVRDFEPAGALFAGMDGLDIYRRLIPQAWGRLVPNGMLALEIGCGQRDAIQGLLDGWPEIEFLDDLQQIPRVALARRP